MATKLTLKEIENISLKPLTEAETIKFCKLWPVVKEVLDLLRDKLKNPVLKAIIQLIIALADTLFKKNCPVPTPVPVKSKSSSK